MMLSDSILQTSPRGGLCLALVSIIKGKTSRQLAAFISRRLIVLGRQPIMRGPTFRPLNPPWTIAEYFRFVYALFGDRRIKTREPCALGWSLNLVCVCVRAIKYI